MNKKKANPNTHQMNQVASSAKNTQAQTSGGQNTNGQTAAAKQVKNCRTCGVLHSHILDCPHFLAVAASQRVNYMHSMRGCLACLTTNHSFDFKKRKEWFSRPNKIVIPAMFVQRVTVLRKICQHAVLRILISPQGAQRSGQQPGR